MKRFKANLDMGKISIEDSKNKEKFYLAPKNAKERNVTPALKQRGYNEKEIEKIYNIAIKSTQKKPPKNKQTLYFGLDGFRKKTTIEIKGLLGSVFKMNQISGAINIKNLYKIYSANFGSGKNKDVFIITNPLENLNMGTNDLYLRPLDIKENKLEFFESECWPEKKLIDILCKERRIETSVLEGNKTRTLTLPEIINKIRERHEESPFLFNETTGLPREELQKIKEKDWQNKLLPDYLNEGWEKDQVFDLVYKSDLLELNPQLISPKNSMLYAPHELVFSNSKTGKTTTAKKTAISVESASTANLLGFSTAHEKIEGSLNNQTKVLRIDEIQEEKADEIHSALNTVLENGVCEVKKGKAGINVKSYATLCWQGNPKFAVARDVDLAYEEKEEDLFQKFSDCLGKISRNHEAFGGRIGSIIFRMDLQKAERKGGMKIEDIEKNEAIVTAVLERARNPFTELYLDNEIVEWLNKPLNESYLKALEQIETKSKLQSIQEFINGHRELASRHVRGKAFKLACVDLAPSLMKGEVDRKELLELAEEYLQQVEEQNLKSFGNLVDVSVQNKAMLDYLKAEYLKLPQHFKILLDTLKEISKRETVKEMPLEELKSNFPNREITGLSDARIFARVLKNMGRSNKILTKFGVVLTGNSKEPKISIKDEELLLKMENEENE